MRSDLPDFLPDRRAEINFSEEVGFADPPQHISQELLFSRLQPDLQAPIYGLNLDFRTPDKPGFVRDRLWNPQSEAVPPLLNTRIHTPVIYICRPRAA